MEKKKISGNEKRKKRLNILLISPYYFVLISLILIPILIMVIYSFTKGESRSLFQVSFTLDNYLNFLQIVNSYMRWEDQFGWLY